MWDVSRALLGLIVVALLASPASAQLHGTEATGPLVPNAIAFRDPNVGLLGTGRAPCDPAEKSCRAAGAISATSDAGRAWRVVLRTRQPVVWVGYRGGVAWARLGDGRSLRSSAGGNSWHRAVPPGLPASPCPPALAVNVHDVVVTPHGETWALCAGQGAAGSMGKAVYRLTADGWRRVAWTPFGRQRGYGGIALYGYPLGIAMARDGFGLIWESRGTLYVTRDGGSHWQALPNIAEPEVDFGVFAAVLPHGIGFALLMRGEKRRLVETHDGGRTWRVRHRWP
jgi:hypothetical protein